MIISEIKLGFGNQLFQYAAGLSLAKHHNVALLLDTSSYDEDPRREFCLKYLEIEDIKTEIETEDENLIFNYYPEPHFHFDDSFFAKPNFTYLSGFWQTEKYFTSIKPEILKRFRVKPEYVQHLNVSELSFNRYNSVSIHIRRTDYAQYSFMGIQPMNYYYKAIDHFKKTLKNIRFYVFSDDIDWVTENFKLDADHVFVSENYTKTNIEDFYLMQQCRHHIIANSTFSWWAAWLCQHPDKRVIAPAKWFLGRNTDTTDLIPKTWSMF